MNRRPHRQAIRRPGAAAAELQVPGTTSIAERDFRSPWLSADSETLRPRSPSPRAKPAAPLPVIGAAVLSSKLEGVTAEVVALGEPISPPEQPSPTSPLLQLKAAVAVKQDEFAQLQQHLGAAHCTIDLQLEVACLLLRASLGAATEGAAVSGDGSGAHADRLIADLVATVKGQQQQQYAVSSAQRGVRQGSGPVSVTGAGAHAPPVLSRLTALALDLSGAVAALDPPHATGPQLLLSPPPHTGDALGSGPLDAAMARAAAFFGADAGAPPLPLALVADTIAVLRLRGAASTGLLHHGDSSAAAAIAAAAGSFWSDGVAEEGGSSSQYLLSDSTPGPGGASNSSSATLGGAAAAAAAAVRGVQGYLGAIGNMTLVRSQLLANNQSHLYNSGSGGSSSSGGFAPASLRSTANGRGAPHSPGRGGTDPRGNAWADAAVNAAAAREAAHAGGDLGYRGLPPPSAPLSPSAPLPLASAPRFVTARLMSPNGPATRHPPFTSPTTGPQQFFADDTLAAAASAALAAPPPSARPVDQYRGAAALAFTSSSASAAAAAAAIAATSSRAPPPATPQGPGSAPVDAVAPHARSPSPAALQMMRSAGFRTLQPQGREQRGRGPELRDSRPYYHSTLGLPDTGDSVVDYMLARRRGGAGPQGDGAGALVDGPHAPQTPSPPPQGTRHVGIGVTPAPQAIGSASYRQLMPGSGEAEEQAASPSYSSSPVSAAAAAAAARLHRQLGAPAGGGAADTAPAPATGPPAATKQPIQPLLLQQGRGRAAVRGTQAQGPTRAAPRVRSVEHGRQYPQGSGAAPQHPAPGGTHQPFPLRRSSSVVGGEGGAGDAAVSALDALRVLRRLPPRGVIGGGGQGNSLPSPSTATAAAAVEARNRAPNYGAPHGRDAAGPSLALDSAGGSGRMRELQRRVDVAVSRVKRRATARAGGGGGVSPAAPHTDASLSSLPGAFRAAAAGSNGEDGVGGLSGGDAHAAASLPQQAPPADPGAAPLPPRGSEEGEVPIGTLEAPASAFQRSAEDASTDCPEGPDASAVHRSTPPAPQWPEHRQRQRQHSILASPPLLDFFATRGDCSILPGVAGAGGAQPAWQTQHRPVAALEPSAEPRFVRSLRHRQNDASKPTAPALRDTGAVPDWGGEPSEGARQPAPPAARASASIAAQQQQQQDSGPLGGEGGGVPSEPLESGVHMLPFESWVRLPDEFGVPFLV